MRKGNLVLHSAVLTGALAVALAVSGMVNTASAQGRGGNSIEVETLCFPNGDVTVTVTDETGDNGGPAVVGDVDIACLANVKAGKGKPNQVNFGNTNIPGPAFVGGVIVIQALCDLGNLPAGANEWFATATASGGNLKKSVSDTCEDQFVADPD